VMKHPTKYTECYTVADCPSRNFIDATPSYMSSPYASLRFGAFMPNNWMPEVRVVAVLREPVSRALSHFNMAGEGGLQKEPFCTGDRVGNAPTFHEEMQCDKQQLKECFEVKLSQATRFMTSFRSVRHGVAESAFDDAYWACLHTVSKIDTQSMMVRGLYSPQLRSWTDPKLTTLKRSQLLVLDFQMMIDDTPDAMRRIGHFYGLGNLDVKKLPHQNSASRWDEKSANGNPFKTVEQIDCETREMMEDFYSEWNAQLVTDLQASSKAKEVPMFEPWFAGFHKQVPTFNECGAAGGNAAAGGDPAAGGNATANGGNAAAANGGQ